MRFERRRGGGIKLLVLSLQSLLTSGCSYFTYYETVKSAMEFADDNRPVVSFVKHLEYQEKLRFAGEKTENLNRSINYNVRLTHKDILSYDIVLEGHSSISPTFDYIAYPKGLSRLGKMVFDLRMICGKGMPKIRCKSVRDSDNFIPEVP